uniref:diaminopimelate epimerase n=2 Tax=Planococcus citri TaxID=170843 RepID=S5N931_9HEMI|nr:diaminopimelate epimerase [Planococcus citri]
MLEKIDFVKMHGLGNDFVIVKSENLLSSQRNLKQVAMEISNRRTGIGCDQFVVYEKIRTSYYNMTLYNIDGSFVKICGNAARCLAKLISDETGEKEFTIKSTIKDLKCRINEHTVTVNMGKVSFQEPWMPSMEKIRSVIEPFAEDLSNLICVDVANPHLVIFGIFTESNKLLVGKKLQNLEYFEDGVNVSFVTIKDNKIHVFIWERGAGPTLACGSAACASFASSLKFGLVESPSEVIFTLGNISMSEQNGDLLMTGETTFVAEGKYYHYF